jgi:hypothetical protein
MLQLRQVSTRSPHLRLFAARADEKSRSNNSTSHTHSTAVATAGTDDLTSLRDALLLINGWMYYPDWDCGGSAISTFLLPIAGCICIGCCGVAVASSGGDRGNSVVGDDDEVVLVGLVLALLMLAGGAGGWCCCWS